MSNDTYFRFLACTCIRTCWRAWAVALLWLVPQTNKAGVEYAESTLMALTASQALVNRRSYDF